MGTTAYKYANAVQEYLPCLVITKDEIFLVQRSPRSEPGYPADVNYPHLVTTMRRPLHPSPQDAGVESFDRHCFSAQIPELGVFIIASPVGRAAVFTFTRCRESNHDGFTYGFQMEYMLPFIKGKEEQVWAPVSSHAKLAGIAVSPVQGMMDKPIGSPSNEDGYDARAYNEGRWRLIMYYTDHTVVSYEVARKKKDGELGLGDIVV